MNSVAVVGLQFL